MKKWNKYVCICVLTIFNTILKTENCNAQATDSTQTKTPSFFKKIHYGLNSDVYFSNQRTDVSIAPSAFTNLNDFVSLGLGIPYQYTYLKDRATTIHSYGISLMGLVNPYPNIQLSAEMEHIRINESARGVPSYIKTNRWNTALFLGFGYRTNRVVYGFRYDVLHNDSKYYSQAYMPFVRFYF